MLIEHDMRVVFNLADRIMVLAEGKVLAEGAPRGNRRQRSGAGGLSRQGGGMIALQRRGAAHLLRQEPYPARRLARGAAGRDRRAARPQRRGQDDDAAQPDGPDAAARGQGAAVRRRRDRLSALPDRRSRRRLRAGGPPHLRQSDGRGEPAGAGRAAGPLDDRRASTRLSRASRSARRTRAASSRAASRRCCRSRAPCC